MLFIKLFFTKETYYVSVSTEFAYRSSSSQQFFLRNYSERQNKKGVLK